MSYKEIMDNKDALIERLISGLSEDGATTVRQDIITEEFENYCTQNGIK